MSYLVCPECGARDAVAKRVITHHRLRRRWWLFGPIVAAIEVVGNVNLCSRCACEWCASPSGVYVPRAGQRYAPPDADNGAPRRPVEDEPRSLRDSDMPWDRARR